MAGPHLSCLVPPSPWARPSLAENRRVIGEEDWHASAHVVSKDPVSCKVIAYPYFGSCSWLPPALLVIHDRLFGLSYSAGPQTVVKETLRSVAAPHFASECSHCKSR